MTALPLPVSLTSRGSSNVHSQESGTMSPGQSTGIFAGGDVCVGNKVAATPCGVDTSEFLTEAPAMIEAPAMTEPSVVRDGRFAVDNLGDGSMRWNDGGGAHHGGGVSSFPW
mmetsp:Transcript_16889/g.32986  ORF Transcript_16889/g.32986 Transcript_16889/m.32986 type:complete len:112 (-) Transcript_16889:240-575(-)